MPPKKATVKASSASSSGVVKTEDEKSRPRYQKLSHIEHVLLRPDTYIGSVRPRKCEEYTAIKNPETEVYDKIEKKEIEYSPAILRVFVEVLSNAIDNVVRSQKTSTKCTKIKVYINKETGEASIWNDGDIIPVEIHETEKCYNHSLIFGQLMTGSNYDDDKEREESGRNGLGAKACCIYSKNFCVKGVDPKNKKMLVQEWTNNMRDTKGPKVTASTLKTGYTQVTWTLDFERFGISGYTDDIINLYVKYVIDSAMLSKVHVYLNDELIPVSTLSEYSKLYTSPSDDRLYIKTPSTEVILSPSSGEYQHISFVNGVYTKLGGVHVDVWTEELLRPLVNKYNKKGKPSLNIRDIKQFFRIFINCTVSRPEFDSQSKLKFEGPAVTATVKPSHITAITKWAIMQDIEDIIRSKEMVVLKKAERKKKIVKVKGYDSANLCGSKDSHNCILILCEGLSAKTYAVAGIEKGVYGKSGRNFFGIYALTGKILNTRNSTPTVIAKNHVITDLVQILGVKYGVDYREEANYKSLSYGKIMLLADSDCFTNDTPIIIKKDNLIDIISMENLYKNGHENIQIWSRTGWTSILAVKKKETDKRILEINTYNGIVKCTEDHKFLLEDGEEILAKDIKIGQRLMRTRRIPKIDCSDSDTLKELKEKSAQLQCFKKSAMNKSELLSSLNMENNFCTPITGTIIDSSISEEEAYVWGLFFAEGTCDVYTFAKDRSKETAKNTERSRERWRKWVTKYETRLSELSSKETLTKEEKNIFRVTTRRLQKARENVNRVSTELKPSLSRTNYSYHIDNCDRSLLEKCKTILENIYSEYNWTIVGTIVPEGHSPSFRLILNGGIKTEEFIRLMRSRFYDESIRKNKKIPVEILNSENNIKESFFKGYYDGDGFRESLKIRNNMGFDILGQVGAQGLCYLTEQLGYCSSIHRKKGDIYTVIISKRFRRFYPGEVRSIKEVNYDHEFVYDIETENHQLNAGIGGIVVHNCDGLHIESLFMNVIHSLFPSLLYRDEPFIVSMKTPIARVFRPRMSDLLFYDEQNFIAYVAEQESKIKAKYYKGLGTTKPEDVPDTFGVKMVEYENDEETSTNMTKVFHKKYADARKEWLANFCPGRKDHSLDNTGPITTMKISDFLNNELIKFSHDDCKRSIPNIIDGLKESQRKILYAGFKRKLFFSGSSLKVAQYGAYTSEHTGYHHGEQNLYDTIVKMANEFPGSNNIPLLYRDGMFGTRIHGGGDAASARYIFTKFEMLTEYLFRKEDEPLLTPVNCDGELVEPEFYVPILPVILINGCTAAIGTGWSSKIPCYNPLDIIRVVKLWIENNDNGTLSSNMYVVNKKKVSKDKKVVVEDDSEEEKEDGEEEEEIVVIDDMNMILKSILPEIHPWYRDFTGTIFPNGVNRYISYGICEEVKKGVVSVSELPVGMWTDDFKEFCEDLVQEKKIKSMQNFSTPKKVSFILKENASGISCDIDSLKLHNYLYTSNMVAFNEKDQIHKYLSIAEIIHNFCTVRYDYYIKRKKVINDFLQKELRNISNKERFVTAVISKDLSILNVEESVIVSELEEKEYDKKDDSYDYLLSMQVRTFTADKVRKLQNDIASLKTKLENLVKTSESQMWLNDIDEFETEYMKWLKVMEGLSSQTASKKRSATSSKK